MGHKNTSCDPSLSHPLSNQRSAHLTRGVRRRAASLWSFTQKLVLTFADYYCLGVTWWVIAQRAVRKIGKHFGIFSD
jgi:hypothetical protein